MAASQRLWGTSYVTRLDRGRLTSLLGQPPPGSVPELVAVLRQKLARAQLVDSYEILPHVVTMNSRLKLRQLRSDDELCFTLAYPAAADTAAGRFPVLSTLGVAVLGCTWPATHGRPRRSGEATPPRRGVGLGQLSSCR